MRPEEGVVLLDRMVREKVVRLGDVRAAVAALPRCPGSPRARVVAQLADGLAESVHEPRLRLVLLHAGFPALTAQYQVFDSDGFVARWTSRTRS